MSHTKYHPVIEELVNEIESDACYRRSFEKALANLKDPGIDFKNYWRDKDIDYLYEFFNEWIVYTPPPNATMAMIYIINFSMFYHENIYGLDIVREEPFLSWARKFVIARGKFMDSAESWTPDIRDLWIKDPRVQIKDFITPRGGFRSFNEFFTKRLQSHARDLDGKDDDYVVVAPTDSLVNWISENLGEETLIPVKGKNLNVSELLHGSRYAEEFLGGTALACFLSITSYHHFHSPVSGTIIESASDIDGWYFGMTDLIEMINKGNVGYNQDFNIFEHFRRGYFIIQTGKYGLVGMVAVGLNTIGSVKFEKVYDHINLGKNLNKDKQVRKGERLGHFAYGGSLVILLFQKGKFNSTNIQFGSQLGLFKPIENAV